MNFPKKAPRRIVKWQHLVLLLTLILMVISALPNFYGDKATLNITNELEAPKHLAKQLIPELSPQTIKQLLHEQNIQVSSVKSSADGFSIVLAKQEHLAKAKQVLIDTLPDDKVVEGAIKNDSPSWLKQLGGQPIKLGLDLSGGVLFVLDVDIERAISDKVADIALDIKSLAREQRIRALKVKQVSATSIKVDFSSTNSKSTKALFKQVLSTYPELIQQKLSAQQVSFTFTEQATTTFRQQTMAQTLKTMRGRIEELGITEAVTQKQGKNRIRIELPGVHDPEEAKRIIGATASLDFYQLAKLNNSINVKHIRNEYGQLLSLNNKVIFSGTNIKNAQAGRDEMGSPLVNLRLDALGGKKMSDFSKRNIGAPMITVFSEYYRDANNELVKKSKVISEATIQGHLSAVFSITNMKSTAAAQELALLLRAGSLAAPVTIVKQRTIAATLGDDNIDNGVKALVIGVSITLIFMALWYRALGMIANVALACNLLSLLGLMSLLPGAVLTLPGIAGLVLTVGMAVDTNVLIFERIKEEIKKGLSPLSAIERGYKNASATIFDANITTMITGIILYSIGYGPVKGFALILCLGILTSMFTGILISKAITNVVINRNDTKLLGAK